jgi:hypothetical protein
MATVLDIPLVPPSMGSEPTSNSLRSYTAKGDDACGNVISSGSPASECRIAREQRNTGLNLRPKDVFDLGT